MIDLVMNMIVKVTGRVEFRERRFNKISMRTRKLLKTCLKIIKYAVN